MLGAGMAYDCVVVGASFAGLACATALARLGVRTAVLEKKSDAGEKLHTTGIIVKDAVDQIPLLDSLPPELTRQIDGVRLYAPNFRFVDLAAPGYYFLATDTPGVLRWLACKAEEAGATILYRTPFQKAKRIQSGFDLNGIGTTRYLIGADGPRSQVAAAFGLGRTEKFLQGLEYEYSNCQITLPDRLHCFINRQLAPGYLAWVLAGVGMVQVGLARRHNRRQVTIAQAMQNMLEKVAPIFDFRNEPPAAVRSGLIPCGGVVSPTASKRVMLVGDAAGMVSPLTAGGIHTALKHGLAAGHAVADYLAGKTDDPSEWFTKSYPSFRTKRWLRFLFDHFQSDWIFNAMIGTQFMRSAASIVYFHHKGVFDADAGNVPVE